MTRAPQQKPAEPVPHRWIVLAVIAGLGVATVAALGVRHVRQQSADAALADQRLAAACDAITVGEPRAAVSARGVRAGTVVQADASVTITGRVGESVTNWHCVADLDATDRVSKTWRSFDE
jgi:hypothetical protein